MDHPLKTWREGLGLNQAEAARMLDLHRSKLCRYEKRNRVPRLHEAIELSEKTGIPLEKFGEREC